MEKILVTGGAGYIGSHTVRLLRSKGFDVVVVDNLSTGHKESLNPSVSLEVVDLKDSKKLDAVFKKYRPNAVIDFAASIAVGESMEFPKRYLENNIYNFLSLLNVMVGNNCLTLIKSSTAATYGNPKRPESQPLKETYTETYHPSKSALLSGKFNGKQVEGEAFFQMIMNEIDHHLPQDLKLSNCNLEKLRIPASIYGLTKLVDEIIMKKYYKKHKLNSVALRYFNATGADDKGDIGEDRKIALSLSPNVIAAALGRKDHLDVFGTDYPTLDGTCIRDYIHINDLADGHIRALHYLSANPGFHVFNLGNGKGFSVKQMIKMAEKVSGNKIKVNEMPRRSGDPVISIADATKANKLLNWHPKYNLEAIIRTAYNWHKIHPKGYSK